ncbi:MAG: hypothetical protein K0R39_1905 [Symbiobacteriaceae bacterium]|jgi:hypothetical protein|nr:hypothetical protein [Symbiobacteriaceae bacterium]
MIPPIEPLRLVVERLTSAGIQAALGGSGLLYSLGLVEAVRDWDLTTDAALAEVAGALKADIPWAPSPTGDQGYATVNRINITPSGADIDMMIRFAVHSEGGVVTFPTIVTGHFRGIPVGSPEVWAVAYELIGRPAKATLLHDYLRRKGAQSDVAAKMLAQPLPEAVRRAVLAWA